MTTWIAIFAAVSAYALIPIGCAAYARVRKRCDELTARLALCEADYERCRACCDELRSFAVDASNRIRDHVERHGEDLTREKVRDLLHGVRLVVDLEEEPTCGAMGASYSPLERAVRDELGTPHGATQQVRFCDLALGEEFGWRGEMWVKMSDARADTTGRALTMSVAMHPAEPVAAQRAEADVHAH